MWLFGLLDTRFFLSGGFRSHGDLWTIEGCRMLVIEVYSKTAKSFRETYTCCGMLTGNSVDFRLDLILYFVQIVYHVTKRSPIWSLTSMAQLQ